MAAVLGGTQSLHTNALDEALALPTAEAATLALADAADHRARDRRRPIWSIRSAGSYFVERLTARSRGRGAGVLRHHRSHGRHGRGHRARLPAAGDRRERLSRSSRRSRQASRSSSASTTSSRPAAGPIGTLYIDESAGERQLARLEALRARRDDGAGQADPRRRCRTEPRERGEYHAAAARRGPRVCHGR